VSYGLNPKKSMRTSTLTIGDCSFDDWPIIDPQFDRISARRFWAVVLLFATAGSAQSVQFRPDLGEDCLSCSVEGVEHELVPPPAEMRTWLMKMGRELVAGNAWRARFLSLIGMLTRRPYSGRVVVEFKGKLMTWIGECRPPGKNSAIIFNRDRSAASSNLSF
jgi:hypothetical protein